MLRSHHIARRTRVSLGFLRKALPQATQWRGKIYTRTGDRGTTSLYTGERRGKTDPTFDALGDVDELNSVLGICLTQLGIDPKLRDQLEAIQCHLLDLGSAIATPLASSSDSKKQRTLFNPAFTEHLEEWIDEMDATLPTLTNFILPGGHPLAAQLHQARSVCRRAERKIVHVVEQGDVDTIAGKYSNRLSDYLFTAARFVCHTTNSKETIYRKRD